jgi:anti-sigma factor RsiW
VTTASSTSCRLLLERLSAYIDGDLPASACDRIERHARQCRRCATVIEELRRTTGLCRRAGEAPLPASVRKLARERIRRLMEAEVSRPPSPRRRKRR